MGILLVTILVFIDQYVKYLTVNNLEVFETMPIIENVFHLTYYRNKGAAFSILSEHTWLLTLISIIAVLVIIYIIFKKLLKHKLGYISLYLILAGAIGNLIDRIRLGYVIDMFDFRIINFAVFNMADVFVSVGGFFLIIYILFLHDKDKINENRQ